MLKSPTVHVLDTHFLEQSEVIGVYLLESDDGLILMETGPETVHEHLKAAIAAAGYNWHDVRHVLLTHIHFDHAGGAWKFARNGAKIYVHPIGLPHMANPTRLWNSAERIYGDNMARLWGSMAPIDTSQLVALEDNDHVNIGGVDITTHYTPGHAIHHNAYQIGDIIFTGDVAGVKINDGPVVPPCPPPDIDIHAWKESLRKLRGLKPSRFYLAHFGVVSSPHHHMDQLETILDDWAAWMKPRFDAGESAAAITPDFVAYTQQQLRDAGVSQDNIDRYESGNPSFMSVTGLLRYWKLHEQGRL